MQTCILGSDFEFPSPKTAPVQRRRKAIESPKRSFLCRFGIGVLGSHVKRDQGGPPPTHHALCAERHERTVGTKGFRDDTRVPAVDLKKMVQIIL